MQSEKIDPTSPEAVDKPEVIIVPSPETAAIESQSSEIAPAPAAVENVVQLATPEMLVSPKPSLVSAETPPPGVSTEPLPLTCPDCGQSCGTTRRELWGHVLNKHGAKRGKEIIGMVRFKAAPWAKKEGSKSSASAPASPPTPPEAMPSFADITGQPDNPATGTATATLDAPATAKVPDYNMLATVVFDMSTGVLCNVLGDEWKPRSEDEKSHVCYALANYFKSKEIDDLPPGMLLAVIVTAYAAPRFRAPTTRDKVKGLWIWFKSKLPQRRKHTLSVI